MVFVLTTANVDRDGLRRECWLGALHAFGTSHVFQRRARRLNLKLRLLTYTGIALPLTVGATAVSFGFDLAVLPAMLAIVSSLLVVQLLVSVWAVVAHWVEAHTYANESAIANDELARRYEALARTPPTDAELRSEFDLLNVDNRNRTQQDMRRDITEREKRRGMRAALRQYQRACATCREVPTSMKPTDCDTCGNF